MNGKYRTLGKVALSSLILASALGCATPNYIQQRRASGQNNAAPCASVSANNQGVSAQTGVNVNFNHLREIPGGLAAGAYGFINPLFAETYNSSEYNELTTFTRSWHNRKAENTGRIAKYLALIFGATKIFCNKGGHGGEETEEDLSQETQRTSYRHAEREQEQPYNPLQPNPSDQQYGRDIGEGPGGQ